MSVSSGVKFNNLTIEDVYQHSEWHNYEKIFKGQELTDATALKNFKYFFLENVEFDSYKSVKILSIIKVFYKNESAVLKKIDKIAFLHFQNQAKTDPSIYRALKLIENLKWDGKEHENKRLTVVKALCDNIEFKFKIVFDENNFFNLGDESKFEVLKFLATKQSYKRMPNTILKFFFQLQVPISYFVEIFDVITKNLESKASILFIAKKNNIERLLNLDPQFLNSLIDKFFRELCKLSDLGGIHEIMKLKTMLAPESIDQIVRDYPDIFIKYWNEFHHLFDTFDKRFALACSCVEIDPDILAYRLLFLFSEQEINEHRSCFDPLIEKCFEKIHHQENGIYLMMIRLYLDKLANNLTFEKEGFLWECIGELKECSGVWAFKAKWEHDFITSRPFHTMPPIPSFKEFNSEFAQRDIFPAVEPYPHEFSENFSRARATFDRLYFFCKSGPSGIYALFPNAELLMSSWESMREVSNNENLPVLSIAECDGITTSEQFIDLLETNDLVYSKNEESVHDIGVHGVSTVLAALQNRTNGPGYYEAARDRLRNIKRETIRIIKAARLTHLSEEEQALLNVLIETLGVLHDAVTARSDVNTRHSLMAEWENDVFIPIRFAPGTGESVEVWPYWQISLWKNETLRNDLVKLGVHDETGSGIPQGFPVERLNEFWKLIKSEFQST